jgi:hypothetical protein
MQDKIVTQRLLIVPLKKEVRAIAVRGCGGP